MLIHLPKNDNQSMAFCAVAPVTLTCMLEGQCAYLGSGPDHALWPEFWHKLRAPSPATRCTVQLHTGISLCTMRDWLTWLRCGYRICRCAP